MLRYNEQMSSSQETIHSFIVKLWLTREVEDDGSQVSGYVVHVPSGEKKYVHELSEIVAFIESKIGTGKKRLHLKQWLKKKLG